MNKIAIFGAKMHPKVPHIYPKQAYLPKPLVYSNKILKNSTIKNRLIDVLLLLKIAFKIVTKVKIFQEILKRRTLRFNKTNQI